MIPDSPTMRVWQYGITVIAADGNQEGEGMRVLIEKGADSISMELKFDTVEYSVGRKSADLTLYSEDRDNGCTVNVDVTDWELDMLKTMINGADRLMYEKQKRVKE